MPFVDAHAHLRTGKLSGTAVPASAAFALRLLQEDMEIAGVDCSLVVTWPEDMPVLADAAARSPGRLYSLLWFDSRQLRASIHDLVLLHARFPSLLVGVKTVFPYLYQSPLQQEFFPLYEFCVQHHLPIQFHCGGNPRMEAVCHPSLFATLARTFPTLPIVCLHGGGGWYREMPALLSTYPNVFLEVEGLQLHEVQLHLPPQVLPYLLQRCESTKMMFGSDRLGREEKYFRRVQFMQSVPQPHREDLCHRTVARVYRLPEGTVNHG
ncbi:MAG: amidohydrolase family protein [Candidatus Binatia bacterium]|nr:amidohydrolase family protein [Candidatus Binatia bacterium]